MYWRVCCGSALVAVFASASTVLWYAATPRRPELSPLLAAQKHTTYESSYPFTARHELSIRSCVQCLAIAIMLDKCNLADDACCTWCCGCSQSEFFQEAEYHAALEAHNKHLAALDAQLGQLPEVNERMNITLEDSGGRRLAVTAHPGAPVSRLMTVLGMDITAGSSGVQFAGQTMLQEMRLDSQAVTDEAILNVHDLAESMLAQVAAVSRQRFLS